MKGTLRFTERARPILRRSDFVTFSQVNSFNGIAEEILIKVKSERYHYDASDITLILEGLCPPEMTTRAGLVSKVFNGFLSN
jgi:hypothetical protein